MSLEEMKGIELPHPLSQGDNTEDLSKRYLQEPDYDRPILEVSSDDKERLTARLTHLYGIEAAKKCCSEIEHILQIFYAYKSPEMIALDKEFDPAQRFTEKDIILITYGDLIQSEDSLPLETLSRFSKRYFNGVINTLHILPFFPYSSDRGFAVTDFEEVDSKIGTWKNIMDLKDDFKLMFDGVFNHISSKSRWFQEFLNGNPEYKDFFMVFSTENAIPEDYLKLIVRPRPSDLLSEFNTLYGKRWVWTTFSRDQVDLNYKNPTVLLKIIDILLTYVRRGADIIRLDAITYLWSQLGTSCAHCDQTHTIIKLFRDILNIVAPNIALISETNVPHEDNITYFGNGNDEVQLVYNFALPPMVLHAFQTGNSSKLTQWATSLKKISDEATYFNFLDSHDGIGLMAVQNILSKEEIELMTLRTLEHGGFISHTTTGDGAIIPYELNITWYSAINRADAREDDDFQVKRFIASRSIALALIGVPGIYLHGLLGSKNDAELVLEEHETRSINRKLLDERNQIEALKNRNSITHKVSSIFGNMALKRTKEIAFHPNACQKVLNISDSIFALIRTSVDETENILALTNIKSQPQSIHITDEIMGMGVESWVDIITENRFARSETGLTLTLAPYDVLWLKAYRLDN